MIDDFDNNKVMKLIAGPCVIESRDHAVKIAEQLQEITQDVGIDFIYKSSFDKANRTSKDSYRHGVEFNQALDILREIKESGIPTLTDVHHLPQVWGVGQVCDIIQIPAFLCRQTDLIRAAASTGKIVNIKKGQFVAPWDMEHACEKVDSGKVLITERGTSFGYNRLVVDFTGIPIMKEFAPVIFDCTHSVQIPGGLGTASGGNREFVEPLARAAVSIGVAGLFMEVHDDPDNAPSDGPNMVNIIDLKPMLQRLVELDYMVKDFC